MLASALDQAKDARMEILSVMNAAIAEPRDDVRDVAPKIISFEIPMDKIGEVIGPKGKSLTQFNKRPELKLSLMTMESWDLFLSRNRSRCCL